MEFSKEEQEQSEELQLETQDLAFEIFCERNAKYGDLWAKEPLEDLLHHVKHKSLRLRENPQLDDALDLVNYSLFIARKLRSAS